MEKQGPTEVVLGVREHETVEAGVIFFIKRKIRLVEYRGPEYIRGYRLGC